MAEDEKLEEKLEEEPKEVEKAEPVKEPVKYTPPLRYKPSVDWLTPARYGGPGKSGVPLRYVVDKKPWIKR